MDVHFLYSGQQFVWDAQKASSNRARHGIDFETACEAFFDDLSAFVDASVTEEQRSAVIGMTESSALLYVVHILVEEDRIRIISARPVTEPERKHYENG